MVRSEATWRLKMVFTTQILLIRRKFYIVNFMSY